MAKKKIQKEQVDPKAPTQVDIKKTKSGQSSTLSPDTEQGRINLSKNLINSVNDLLTRARIINNEMEKAIEADTAAQYKEQLILMNESLLSLKNKDLPNLIRDYLTTVKQYEKERGRDIKIAANENKKLFGNLSTLLEYLLNK